MREDPSLRAISKYKCQPMFRSRIFPRRKRQPTKDSEQISPGKPRRRHL